MHVYGLVSGLVSGLVVGVVGGACLVGWAKLGAKLGAQLQVGQVHSLGKLGAKLGAQLQVGQVHSLGWWSRLGTGTHLWVQMVGQIPKQNLVADHMMLLSSSVRSRE